MVLNTNFLSIKKPKSIPIASSQILHIAYISFYRTKLQKHTSNHMYPSKYQDFDQIPLYHKLHEVSLQMTLLVFYSSKTFLIKGQVRNSVN